jgi:hypothetical protein
MLSRIFSSSREYADGKGVRLAVATASSAATALPVLGETREVRIAANTDCWLRFGGGSVAASVAGTSIPLYAGGVEVTVVPAWATHFAVIRDSADGFITLTPVA